MGVELATSIPGLRYCGARPRLDLAYILLNRRVVSSSRWVHFYNRSIHIQCDSSPIAERELFGMVFDVIFLGMTWVERCPTDAQLAETKCITLLWVLLLITAPNNMLFADVLQHIRSFTTDQGVEACMVTEGIETALIFAKHVGVRLLGDIIAHGLTFPFAVHISDWNHIIMNTMCNACEAGECWPVPCRNAQLGEVLL